MENVINHLEIGAYVGGYGGYVLSAFVVAGVVAALMVFFSLRSLRRAENTLKTLQNIKG